MLQNLDRPFPRQISSDRLFSGIWIRWQALTTAERFVCTNIVLLPVWWVAGLIYYMPLFLQMGIALYELWKYKKLRLKQPSVAVMALLAFGAYQLVRLWQVAAIPPRLFEVVIWTLCPAFWLWYIQSNKIKIRVEVVAWAVTISVIQQIGFWFLLQFVLPKSLFLSPPVPNLKGLLANEPHYLIPQWSYGGFAGLRRFSLFLDDHPLRFSVVAGVMGLIALDIKNRLWSWLLLLGCVFLIFLSASRMVLVAFPVVVVLRYLVANLGKSKFVPTLLALIAIASFTTLSLPPVTSSLTDTVSSSANTVSELRADSTEVRLEIYQQTWEAVKENPIWGYAKVEETIGGTGQYVGGESFILGNLLYLSGLVGTAMFLVFWVSFFVWLYQTRAQRPLCCFSVLIFYSLISVTQQGVYRTALSSMCLMVCATLYNPKKRTHKVRYL